MALGADEPVDRYIPGAVSTIVQTMELDDGGVLSVGNDGVLRSFAADGTVIDYHQLDPSQVESFAEHQLAAWESQGTVPESVKDLAEATTEIDGRLITDKQELLNPSEKPNFHHDAKSVSKERDVLDELSNNFVKRQCNYYTCSSLADCTPLGCFACFFTIGPPFGICFSD
ncbi:hypothetical protein BX600DRAFT_518828 [Xylariales sp. PMI_506]|nr:hypothetical protein BX600DRAFT_518828 [Xylariales sp. PMI_506]